MAAVVNVNDLLNDHVVLDLECLDRIYLNAYVPNLQTSGRSSSSCAITWACRLLRR
jgi:hypothetical protein